MANPYSQLNSPPESSHKLLIYWPERRILYSMRAKILILGLACLLMLDSAFSAERKHIKSWLDYFPDPIERIYVVMKDEIAFKFTNHEERLVYMGAGILENILKKRGYKIKDIAIIIHNHRFEQKFSPADWRFYGDLMKRGFDGYFLIYCHRTKEVYPILNQ